MNFEISCCSVGMGHSLILAFFFTLFNASESDILQFIESTSVKSFSDDDGSMGRD